MGYIAQRKDHLHKSHDFWRTKLFNHLSHQMLLLKLSNIYSYLAETDLQQILLGLSLAS